MTQQRTPRGISTSISFRLWCRTPNSLRICFGSVGAARNRDGLPAGQVVRGERALNARTLDRWISSAGPQNMSLPPSPPRPGPISTMLVGATNDGLLMLDDDERVSLVAQGVHDASPAFACRVDASPTVGSSMTKSVLTNDAPRQVVRLTRSISPPESAAGRAVQCEIARVPTSFMIAQRGSGSDPAAGPRSRRRAAAGSTAISSMQVADRRRGHLRQCLVHRFNPKIERLRLQACAVCILGKAGSCDTGSSSTRMCIL